MERSARESYLESQVLTATPQKLRLMLIEAALGAARQTLEFWDQQEQERAIDALIRCRNIITELLAGIRVGDDPLVKRVTGVYVFLFKALTEAQLRRDEDRMQDVIRVLEIERETWRKVCDEVPHAVQLPLDSDAQPKEISSSQAQNMLSGDVDEPPAGSGGLLLDA